jgi:starch synthase
MYSQRYGTVPVVRRTGGLADTVVDASAANLADGTATGVLFDYVDVSGVTWGLTRALELMRDPQVWLELQLAGMRQDFSWVRAAREYVTLYERVGT